MKYFSFLVLNLFAATSLAFGAPAPETSGLDPLRNSESYSLNERGVNALKGEKYTDAENLFRRALDSDPKNLTAAFNLAGAYLTNKKIDESIKLLEAYTAQYSEDPGLFSRLGDAYFAAKRLKDAAGAYEKALALDATYPRLVHRLASVYGLLNRRTDAEAMMRAAVDQDPSDVGSLSSLASLLLAGGKPDEAISTAKRSLQLKPTSEAYVTLGAAYEEKKDANNALIAFKRARDLGDKREELEERIEALEERVEQKA